MKHIHNNNNYTNLAAQPNTVKVNEHKQSNLILMDTL